jgi:hypothetical protein
MLLNLDMDMVIILGWGFLRRNTMAEDILSKAASEILSDLQKDWTSDKELALCMVRRALRHILGFKEMYFV